MDYNTLEAYTAANAATSYLDTEDDLEEAQFEEFDVVAPDMTTRGSKFRRCTAFAGSFDSQFKFDSGTVRAVVFQSGSFYTLGGWADHPFPVTHETLAPTFGVAWAKPSVGELIVSDLGRIKDGWAGEGTIAPSRETVADVEAVVERLPANVKMPSLEVEEEDGTVSLRWLSADQQKSFSLVFTGNGRVTGVLATTQPPRSKAWSADTNNDVQVADKIEGLEIGDLIAG